MVVEKKKAGKRKLVHWILEKTAWTWKFGMAFLAFG